MRSSDQEYDDKVEGEARDEMKRKGHWPPPQEPLIASYNTLRDRLHDLERELALAEVEEERARLFRIAKDALIVGRGYKLIDGLCPQCYAKNKILTRALQPEGEQEDKEATKK